MKRRTRTPFGRTDELARLFDQGPFAGVQVEPWPARFVELYEHASGGTFDSRLFAAYERVRAFLAHEGVIMVPMLQVQQVLDDPMPARRAAPPVLPPDASRLQSSTLSQASHVPVSTAVPSTFDPSDLGD